MSCSIVREVIDIEALRLRVQNSEAGAVLIFCGDIRNHSQQREVSFLEYEAHESMALKQIYQVVEEAQKKWQLHTVEVIHRLGKLAVKDCSIAIAVSTSHRGDAYEASRYIIDTIKHAVPIWKKEHFVDTTAMWSKGCEASSVVDDSVDAPAVVKNEVIECH
jgi:molybdopterin synthase catalytic subunit